MITHISIAPVFVKDVDASMTVPKTMRAAIMTAKRKCEIVDVPVPKLEKPDWVLVRILKVGVCGTDLSVWDDKHILNKRLHGFPLPPGSHGHEAVGVVVAAGPEATVKVGDMVVRINLVGDWDWDMRCWAEYAVADRPIVVNEGDIDAVWAADPLAVAMIHVQSLFSPNLRAIPMSWNLQKLWVPGGFRSLPGRKPAVLMRGYGFIADLCAGLLRDVGIVTVATEIEPRKVESAKNAAVACFYPEEFEEKLPQFKDDLDFIGCIECCGSSDLDTLIKVLGPQSTCVVMGTSRERIELEYGQLRAMGITLAFPSNAAYQAVTGTNYWEPAARLLASGAVQPQSKIDAVFPFEELQEALEFTAANPWVRRTLVEVSK